MTHLNTYARDLLRLPLAKIQAAADRHGVSRGTKIDMVAALGQMIEQGQILTSDIANAAPMPVAAPAAHAAVIDAARTQEVKDLQTTVETLAKVIGTHRQALDSAAHVATKAHDATLAQGQTLAQIDATLTALTRKVDTAPAIDASAAVAQAVRDAFKPFEAAVAAAGAQAEVAAIAAAGPVGQDTVDNVFGITVNIKNNMVDIYNHNDSWPVDNQFIWQENILRHLLQSQHTGENVWLGGEKGTGKTQTIQQFAARTGRGFTRISFHKYSTVEEYIGAVGLVNGATQFVEGPFLRAYTRPGSVILLDEISNCDPGELAMLNGLLEPNAAVTIHGKVYRRAPGVLIFAADNTLGSGDASGRYAGVRNMNAALLDRFARAVPFTFLPKQVEVDALIKHTGCSKVIADHVIDAINVCRAKVAQGALVDAPSLRQALAFVEACRWHSVPDAWATAIAAKQPSEGLVALEAVYAANINPALIAKNI